MENEGEERIILPKVSVLAVKRMFTNMYRGRASFGGRIKNSALMLSFLNDYFILEGVC